jgi:hypothetical protein
VNEGVPFRRGEPAFGGRAAWNSNGFARNADFTGRRPGSLYPYGILLASEAFHSIEIVPQGSCEPFQVLHFPRHRDFPSRREFPDYREWQRHGDVRVTREPAAKGI